MKPSRGHPTFPHNFPAESIYRYADQTDPTLSKVGSDFDPQCLSWRGEIFRNSAQKFERNTYDRASGSIKWSKKTVPQIKDYLSATNDYLEEETGDVYHAGNIRERICQIERASETALTDLDVIRGDMWEGYHFDRDTCVTKVIGGLRPSSTLLPADITLDLGIVDRSPLPETRAVSNGGQGSLVEKEEIPTEDLDEEDWVLLDSNGSGAGRAVEK